MFRIYLMIFWIPAIASAVMLVAMWRTGVFTRPMGLVVWYLVALALQVIGGLFSPVWTIGLVLQVVLAVYVAIRFKLAKEGDNA